MLNKTNRLKKRKEFNFIFRKGQVVHSSLFTIHHAKALKKTPQVGISVSKQVGNSVVRSRVKRIISEAFRHIIDNVVVRNYVVSAKEAIKDKKSTEVEQELVRVLRKNGLLKEDKNV